MRCHRVNHGWTALSAHSILKMFIWPCTAFSLVQKTRYPAVRNFDQFARLFPLRTLDICLEISSDYKYCLGLKVEATVELGHRVKSQCFRHLENIQVLTHKVNSRWTSTEIIDETSQEYLVFVQKRQAILNKGFVLLWKNSPRLH